MQDKILCSISTRGRYFTTLPLAISAVITQSKPISRLVIFDDNDDPQDVRKVEGEMSDDVADQLRYGLKSHIRARDEAPFDVRQLETFRAYQDPTERVRALEILQQQERATSRIRRRYR